MIVKQTRDKRADNEIVALKSLVSRRRLVNTTRDRLEISDIEDPGIKITVPPDHIKGMMVKFMTG